MLRSRLLISLLLLFLISAVIAQRGGNDNEEDDEEPVTAPATNTRNTQAANTATRVTTPTRTAAATATRTQNNDDEEDDEENEDEPGSTDLPAPTTAAPTRAPTAASVVTITGGNTITDTSSPADASDAPPPAFGIPTVTPPSVKGSPFLRQSDLPEGTIFIVVGAALGFFGLVVILWRAIIAWMLHRSMHKPPSKPGIIDTKSMARSYKNGGGGGGFYAAGAGSMHSLDHLASANRSPGLPPPNSSLFFSPTSSAQPPTTAGTGDRRSAYLPPGFYAAGNRKSTAISNSSQTQFQRPRGSGISPPGTPLMVPASRGASSAGTERLAGMRINDSQTSLSLPPTGRAPSAYLEDLFESHPIPEQQPPPMPHHG